MNRLLIKFHSLQASHFRSTLSLLNLKDSCTNKNCMSSSHSNPKKQSKKSSSEALSYLEKKYGKEPKISAKELAQTRWNWH